MLRAIATLIVAHLAWLFSHTPASAVDFFEGKTVSLLVGYGPGAFDNYARLLAQHVAVHIPGKPSIVVKAMPGAATMTLTNHLYTAAPKDGTAFGSIHERVALEPLFGNNRAQYDSLKFNWIGSIHSQTMVCVAWHAAKVKTLQDAMKTEIIMGASGVSGSSFVGPHVLNSLLGTKMKIIAGYSTSDGMDVFLAMERGEVEGRCMGWAGLKSTVPQWIEQKRINILVQLGITKHPELPNVPLVTDFVKSDADWRALSLLFGTQIMGRPYVAPPGLPPDRVAILRTAFNETMKDSAFIADARSRGLEVDPATGQQIEERLHDLYQIPKDVVNRVVQLQKK